MAGEIPNVSEGQTPPACIRKPGSGRGSPGGKVEAPLKITRPRRVEVGEAQGGRENLPVKMSLKTKIQNP